MWGLHLQHFKIGISHNGKNELLLVPPELFSKQLGGYF